MADELDQLADWAAPLLRAVDRRGRQRIAREVARDLRRSQTDRLKRQQNPDGTPFAPRKPQGRRRAGAIKRQAMFRRLRTARYLRLRSTPDQASVAITGRAAVIARVHQQGKRSRVDRNGPTYDYPVRTILGFSKADRDRVGHTVINAIDRNTP